MLQMKLPAAGKATWKPPLKTAIRNQVHFHTPPSAIRACGVCESEPGSVSRMGMSTSYARVVTVGCGSTHHHAMHSPIVSTLPRADAFDLLLQYLIELSSAGTTATVIDDLTFRALLPVVVIQVIVMI